MDNDGNAVITWFYQSAGSHNQVFMSEYRDGAWSHPGDLSDNISPDEQRAYSPQVVMDNNGNAIITWYQYDGNVSQIFMSAYR